MIQITRSTRKTSQKTRDLCLQSFDRLTQRKDIGFFQLPEREAPWRLTEERVSQLSSQFQNFVFVGIGGSGLGGRTVRDCLNPQFQNKQISFLENVDPVALNFFFQSYKSLDSTHWVFISKSGSTLETLALANAIQHYL